MIDGATAEAVLTEGPPRLLPPLKGEHIATLVIT
jgi:hypothetical protein